MDNKDIADAVFRGLLGRKPNQKGLEHYTAALDRGVDLARLISRLEQKKAALNPNGHQQPVEPIDEDVAELIRKRLGAGLVVVDIGAQILPDREHEYQKLIDHGLVERIVGFEPLEELAAARNVAEPLAEIHPIALGTGEDAILHVTEPSGGSSLFPPDPGLLADHGKHRELEALREMPLKTTRLDDIDLPDRIDLMKLDVQGYELPILQHGPNTLDKTLWILTETMFRPMYIGQPLFGAMFEYLVGQGFSFHSFPRQVLMDPPEILELRLPVPRKRLFWADAAFFRDTPGSPEDLLRQAAVAHFVQRSLDSAYQRLVRYDRETGDSAAQVYGELLAGIC